MLAWLYNPCGILASGFSILENGKFYWPKMFTVLLGFLFLNAGVDLLSRGGYLCKCAILSGFTTWVISSDSPHSRGLEEFVILRDKHLKR